MYLFSKISNKCFFSLCQPDNKNHEMPYMFLQYLFKSKEHNFCNIKHHGNSKKAPSYTVLCKKNANEFRRNSPFVYTNSHVYFRRSCVILRHHFSKKYRFAAWKFVYNRQKLTHLQTIFQSDFVNSRTKIQIAYRKLLILKEVLFSCNNWRNLLQTKTLFWNCTIVNLLLVWYYNMHVSAKSELKGGFKSSHKNTALWKE